MQPKVRSVRRSGTFRFAKIGEVAIDIHLSSALAILSGAWAGWMLYGSLSGAAYGVLAILLLFTCLLLHELAHGLLAHMLGLATNSITVLPVGLLLEIPPALPRQEIVIAMVGPLINLVSGTALAILTYNVLSLDLFSPEAMWVHVLVPTPSTILLYLIVVNFLLGAFNMLPAFPMDGGRILRAGLALVFDYVTATRIATRLGRTLAVVMGLIGLIGFPPMRIPPDLFLVIVAGIVYFGAHREEVHVRQQHALVHIEVGDIYQGFAETISPWAVITKELATYLFKHEQVLPVVIDNRLVGILTYQEARKALEQGNPITAAHVMCTDFPVLQLRDTLWVALKVMNSSQLARVPVVDEGLFRGVINLDDIERAWRIPIQQEGAEHSLKPDNIHQ